MSRPFLSLLLLSWVFGSLACQETGENPSLSPSPLGEERPLTQSELSALIGQALKADTSSVEWFIKDLPIPVMRIEEGTLLKDLPAIVLQYLGRVDWQNNPYDDAYLQRNWGGAIAFQFDDEANQPDLYVIGANAFVEKYQTTKFEEVTKKNPRAMEQLRSIDSRFEELMDDLQGALKRLPVRMIRMSRLGFRLEGRAQIVPPWGGDPQTKKSGSEGFLVIEEKEATSDEPHPSDQYYMINAQANGNPIAYVPASVSLSKE